MPVANTFYTGLCAQCAFGLLGPRVLSLVRVANAFYRAVCVQIGFSLKATLCHFYLLKMPLIPVWEWSLFYIIFKNNFKAAFLATSSC